MLIIYIYLLTSITLKILVYLGTGTASIRVLDINDMSPNFSKDEWMAEVDETDSENLPETSVLIVTVHDGDEISNFQYKVVIFYNKFYKVEL